MYSGTAVKFVVVMGLLLFVGYKADSWFSTGFPIMVWLLPLLGVIGLVLKAVHDTSKK